MTYLIDMKHMLATFMTSLLRWTQNGSPYGRAFPTFKRRNFYKFKSDDELDEKKKRKKKFFSLLLIIIRLMVPMMLLWPNSPLNLMNQLNYSFDVLMLMLTAFKII